MLLDPLGKWWAGAIDPTRLVPSPSLIPESGLQIQILDLLYPFNDLLSFQRNLTIELFGCFFFSFRVSGSSSLTNLPISLCERLIAFVIVSIINKWKWPHALTLAECLCKGLLYSDSQVLGSWTADLLGLWHIICPQHGFTVTALSVGARPRPRCSHTVFCFGIWLTRTKMDREEPRAKDRQDASEEKRLSLLKVKTHY